MSPKRLNVALPRPWRLHQTGRQLDGHEPSLAEHHKDGIHMVRFTTLAPSVTVRSTCSDVARYHFGILRQIHSIRRSVPQSTLSSVDAHLQLRRDKTGLLQRRSRQPAKLRPGPSAVRHQRCHMPDSWRAPPQPHHSTPCGPPLAAHTSAHPVQAVRTGLPVRSGVRTELPAECHLLGRECGTTASPAIQVIGRSHRAGDATYNNGRPRLRHCRFSRLEQSA